MRIQTGAWGGGQGSEPARGRVRHEHFREVLQPHLGRKAVAAGELTPLRDERLAQRHQPTPDRHLSTPDRLLVAVAAGDDPERGTALGVGLEVDRHPRDPIRVLRFIPVRSHAEGPAGRVAMPADAAAMGVQVGVLRVAGRRPQHLPDGRDQPRVVDQRPELAVLGDAIGALEAPLPEVDVADARELLDLGPVVGGLLGRKEAAEDDVAVTLELFSLAHGCLSGTVPLGSIAPRARGPNPEPVCTTLRARIRPRGGDAGASGFISSIFIDADPEISATSGSECRPRYLIDVTSASSGPGRSGRASRSRRPRYPGSPDDLAGAAGRAGQAVSPRGVACSSGPFLSGPTSRMSQLSRRASAPGRWGRTPSARWRTPRELRTSGRFSKC